MYVTVWKVALENVTLSPAAMVELRRHELVDGAEELPEPAGSGLLLAEEHGVRVVAALRRARPRSGAGNSESSHHDTRDANVLHSIVPF